MLLYSWATRLGFPNVVNERYSVGHEQQRGKRGPWGHNLNFTLDIFKLQMKSKKKKASDVFYSSLWVIFLKEAMTFFISSKEVICKKVWETKLISISKSFESWNFYQLLQDVLLFKPSSLVQNQTSFRINIFVIKN